MSDKRKFNYAFLIMISLIAVFLTYSPVAQAQNWLAMPPYNTLWPLWSPALSPIDSATGLPVPIVNELLPSTVLPVQPGLTWDPAAANPWLLYNTPLGMAYYDPVDGVNLWPPSYLRDSLGAPLPLGLPVDYGLLPPTPSSWITATVPQANVAAYFYLMGIPAPIFAPTLSPTFGPVATPVFGPTATPVFGPTATPIFGGPTFFTPVIGGVPLFLQASALLPVAPIPAPVPVVPPVTTLVAPPIPSPILTSAIAPSAVVSTVLAPTASAVVPAAISGIFFPFI
ncbi:MAG: hypothetical protein ACMUIA_12510 [bacterium]